jgi:hypothetical protein
MLLHYPRKSESISTPQGTVDWYTHISKTVYKQPGLIQQVLRASRRNSVTRGILWDPRTHAADNSNHKKSEAGPCRERTAPQRQAMLDCYNFILLLVKYSFENKVLLFKSTTVLTCIYFCVI